MVSKALQSRFVIHRNKNEYNKKKNILLLWTQTADFFIPTAEKKTAKYNGKPKKMEKISIITSTLLLLLYIILYIIIIIIS